MRCLFPVLLAIALADAAVVAQAPATNSGYRVLQTIKAGGDGGFDYVYADSAGRRLYIPRSGSSARVMVFDLDTMAEVGEIPNVAARGAAVDPVSHHGFASSKPVFMWDTTTLKVLKTIDVQGNPDGILFDPFNARVYVFSHSAPNATVIDARAGSVIGTIDFGGAPEQAVTDGKGRVYVALEDKDSVAVVDAAAMTVTARYDLGGKGGGPAGLGFDPANGLLFVACHEPHTMVIMKASDGAILATLPIGTGVDGALFNPATKEAFSSQGDGTLTVVRETSPTSFVVAQTVSTMTRAKTLTLDTETNHIILIAAEYGPPASPPPAGSRGGRGQMVPGSFSILVVGK
jgi:DNA-binding beta-propeller fold protein YncE